MAEKIFCEHCLDDVTYPIEEHEMTRKLKGTDYTFLGKAAFCDACIQPVIDTLPTRKSNY